MANKNVHLDDVIKLHRELANNIKKYETTINKNLPKEVLNELRYSFRSLIDYLDSEHTEENSNQYHLTRSHYALLCAYFDLVDGLVIEINSFMKNIIEKYPEESIQVINNFSIIYNYMENINNKISSSRGVSQEEKIIIYQEINNFDFDTIADHYKELERSEVLIHKLYNQKNKHRKISYFIGISGLIIGAIGILVAILK